MSSNEPLHVDAVSAEPTPTDVCRVRSYYSLKRDECYTLVTVGGPPGRQWWSETPQSYSDEEIAKGIVYGQIACQEAWERAYRVHAR